MFALIPAISLVLLINVSVRVESSPVSSARDEIPSRPLENPDLFQGDILLRTDETFSENGVFRNAIPSDNLLWPDGVIPYEIDPELDAYKEKILLTMKGFSPKTCIRFKERTIERDYVRLIAGKGCSSYVGRLGGPQNVSLGTGCYCTGTIAHEIMHAVGFHHEHNRSDRDEYVTIVRENIMKGHEKNFNKLSPSQNRLLAPYDYREYQNFQSTRPKAQEGLEFLGLEIDSDSIMHYDAYAFTKAYGKKTMVPTQPGVYLYDPCDNHMSPRDVEKINLLYKCNTK